MDAQPDTRPPAHAQRPAGEAAAAHAEGPEPLDAWAAALARAHAGVSTRPRRGNALQRRLAANRRQLIANYRATLEAVLHDRWISPAGEWLIDNFHVIDEQLREARKSLPAGFYRQLPRLSSGPDRGTPRAFAVAAEMVEHTDGRLDIALLQRFLTAYQEVTPLSIGELWAIPIALRHAFLARLAEIAARVDLARREREAAASLAADLARTAAHAPGQVAEALRHRVARRVQPSTTMFATELAQRLRDQHPALTLAVEWLDRRLAESGTTLEEAIRAEHRSQSANQTSVGNVIGSMRTITATDWSQVFESLSVVDRILRRDPSGDYGGMDFVTRDRYRHVVERIARRAGRAEHDVAEAAVALADAAPHDDTRQCHVGYYLIDHGIVALGHAIGYRPRLGERGGVALLERRTALYLGAIAAGSLLVVALLLECARALAIAPWAMALLALLSVIPASELAIDLVNLAVCALRTPIPLPKLDFRHGVPAQHRTLVAVPSMLASVAAIEDLIEGLEVRFLGNPEVGVCYALVTDFCDAPQQTDPGDASLLSAAVEGIRRLERQHGPGRFFLLHRRRLFSEDEQRFMGWERKRGKLSELNRLLLGDDDTTFSTVVGELRILRTCRLVLTLDTDTQLPRGTAVRLVGAMAHPLNRPRIDPGTQRVLDGHAVLQPRVSIAPISARRSHFAHAFADQEGIDPYTTAVSDVYQDLFDEGSFVGKGIYDVRAFAHAQAQRIPERAVLSHDLLEGCFARAGLVSDVELFEDTPSHYLAASSRRHRWIRGDWQIARWLRARAPLADGSSAPNPLSALARWKIFDNLRRSLVPPALLALMLAGWLCTDAPLRWTALVLLLIALPLFLQWLTGTVRVPVNASWRSGVVQVSYDTLRTALRSALTLLFLPHQAWVSLDATARALYRMLVSHRQLLEWVSAAQAERAGERGVVPLMRAMAPALVPIVLTAAAAHTLHGAHALALQPLVVAWLAAPLVAARMSRLMVVRARPLSVVARHLLRRTARKTWSWFETFVTETDHFLPVDNFQEDPSPVIAHRTSPTNIGLSLLATLSAHQLGYVGLGGCVDRLERTLHSVERLERHHGHLFNWYDTITLRPLSPRYVSMVDSGNLAAALIAVEQACLRASTQPQLVPPTPALLDGIVDTLRLVEEHASHLRGEHAEAVRARIADLEPLLEQPPVDRSGRRGWLEQLRERVSFLAASLPAIAGAESAALARWTSALIALVEAQRADLDLIDPEPLRQRLLELARRASALVGSMDFAFLFDADQQLFAIGFDVSADRRDASFYDLLASEARLGSFIAIARGQVPLGHWHRLGRPLTRVSHRRALLSWSGSMFEYLMPSLLLPTYPNTLLDEACSAVVMRQIRYGRETRVPWGVSESAYNARDLHLNYQYGPFGVPGLGIKRGLAEDVVVAPYATALALSVDPSAAAENLWRLTAEGMDGAYGFYESIDYTPPRVPEGERGAIVRAFMAHHQAMTLVSIAEHLCDHPLREAFWADPRVRASELLLQERIPYAVPFVERHGEGLELARAVGPAAREEWVPFTVDAEPEVQLLSNGAYSVMLSLSGGGYSRWRGLDVTRWREDPTRDCWGQFLYIRDIARARRWSPTYQPLLGRAETLAACFSLDKAELRRTEAGIESHLLISVATEDDAEVRALSLTNRSSQERELEVTSYAEIVLAPHAADAAHPAFGKLFVETELVSAHSGLLATRRPRVHDEPRAFAVHVCAMATAPTAPPEHETSRERFIGRWRSPRDPAALEMPLSGTTGPVLDPIFSLRRRVRIPPGKSVRLFYTTAVADTREAALALAAKYGSVEAAERAPALAWTHAQSQLHYLDIDLDDTRRFRQLAARLLYAERRLRAPDQVIASNTRGQSALWAYGISGDLPILLVRTSGPSHLHLVRDALHAHEFLRMRGLELDLVILNEHPPSYLQTFQDELVALARARASATLVDKRGGIFVRRADLIPPEDRNVLISAARVVLVGERGTLADQLGRVRHRSRLPTLPPARALAGPADEMAKPLGLHHDNGLGGFTADGREYVLRVDRRAPAPAPWANLLCNPRYGALVTDSGGGYDWVDNAHENRLTEWSNDPVSDPAPATIYLRDEASGVVSSATPLPAGGDAQFLVRHGQGYSVFERSFGEVRCELVTLVAVDAPMRLWRLTLHNRGRMPRRLSVTGYIEWTLGVVREESARHVVTQLDGPSGAFLARNTYPGDLGARVAVVDTVPRFQSCTGDRAEFLGHQGDAATPAGLRRHHLSGRVGAALDPCAAVQVPVTIGAGKSATISLMLGQGADVGEARELVRAFREPGAVTRELTAVQARWEERLGALQIETPDHALDLLVNRWLLYQVISARLWGRSGLYQSGGAYGFRDQLQDVASLVYTQPRLAREHLLRAAARQFVEGDAQHWWHPPSGRGVRTRFSDDYLWLPFVAARYLEVTGDHGLLDEPVAFLEARALAPDEAEVYLLPSVSTEVAPFYQHCVRALDRSLGVGAHGLPLMGAGDWNDGMNRVGAGGAGESVWMAWFLIANLRGFAPVCAGRDDSARATRYLEHATRLAAAVEQHAWDGEWYLRAFFDDGTPLGSARAEECQIDSIAQSWSVLSGAGDRARAERAVAAAEQRLVDRDAGLVKLLAPPFDRGERDPGYIKGYVPGVRENGGQYTHAAIWLVLAETLLGHGDRAYELLRMLNPVLRTSSAEGVATYRIEPYVLAGDVAARPPHLGRGGWSWYTGAASWMYRVVVEALLGLDLRAEALTVRPCIPRAWPGFTVRIRRGKSKYTIRVENPDHLTRGVVAVELDGRRQPPGDAVALDDDGAAHVVRI